MRVLIDGLWHEIQLWLPKFPDKLTQSFELPEVNLDRKKCDDPEDKKGSDECGDVGGG